MLRLVRGAVRMMLQMTGSCIQTANVQGSILRELHVSSSHSFQDGCRFVSGLPSLRALISPSVVQVPSLLLPPTRTVTKFSRQKGKRKTVKTVLHRFYRLHWGGWIRTRAGRHRFLWKKTDSLKRRLRQHVFCNSTQSYLLDKMVTKYWRKPRFYVDDPYEPYHSREEFFITRKKPRP